MDNQSHKTDRDSGKSFYIFFIFFGAIPGVLVGILVGVFLLRDIDDTLLSYSTVVGSLGTLGTFMFLIYDALKNRKAAKARDVRQEEMWAFQKYQMHKNSFDELLDSLEGKYSSMGLKFYSRTKLYSFLFPNNTFSLVELKSGTINKISQSFEQELNPFFKRPMSIDPVPELVSLFSDIFSCLSITFITEPKLGQITHFDNDTCFNLFDYNTHICAWQSVLDELIGFSNPEAFERDRFQYHRFSESEFIMVMDNLLNETFEYSLFIGNVNQELFRELWLANKQIKLSLCGFTKRAHTNGFFKPIFICHPLFDLFTPKKLKKLEKDNDFCLEVIGKFLSSLDKEISKGNDRKKHLEGSKKRLLVLSKSLTNSKK